MMVTPNRYDEHTQQKQNIAQAQQEIQAAVQRAWPDFYQAPPMKEEVSSESCKKLSLLQIGTGVRAMVLACNLRGGSTGDVNIYELMQAYFWDQDARERINEIVEASLAPAKH